jgi:hypothetical protein
VELGASFVHCPDAENRIAQFVDSAGLAKEREGLSSDIYYYEQIGIMPYRHVAKAWQLHEEMEVYGGTKYAEKASKISVEQLYT